MRDDVALPSNDGEQSISGAYQDYLNWRVAACAAFNPGQKPQWRNN
jgi:hypothetical protein